MSTPKKKAVYFDDEAIKVFDAIAYELGIDRTQAANLYVHKTGKAFVEACRRLGSPVLHPGNVRATAYASVHHDHDHSPTVQPVSQSVDLDGNSLFDSLLS